MHYNFKNEYTNVPELNFVLALEFIPPSLRFMLENILPGKETNRKVASIGQTIVQAVRLRTVIAPLQIGLAIQMHHHFRSRFLIDTLSSYQEVQRFEENVNG